MKRTIVVMFAIALVALSAGFASANTPRIERREVRQHARIHQGVRSGELTRREAVRLRAGQRHVHRMEYRAKADGRVGPRERARIARAQNHQSRSIYRFKHNARVR
jgi:hypothetical protein